MPYKDQNMQLVRDGLTGSSEFAYETEDSATEVVLADYFVGARYRFRRNDVIRVVAEAESDDPAFAVFIVANVAGPGLELVSVVDLVEARIGGHGWARIAAPTTPSPVAPEPETRSGASKARRRPISDAEG